ncbi:hypothetical protein JCGZ_10869 [Jatropha curcas]|uniref:Uncharacterized protein n=1 Tax=Jatropha curcas TaxID=180498 RepID=A0A067KGV7_JATCU|nr:hypothetical protein JCGZ_10869 [Jatropha curcas]
MSLTVTPFAAALAISSYMLHRQICLKGSDRVEEWSRLRLSLKPLAAGMLDFAEKSKSKCGWRRQVRSHHWRFDRGEGRLGNGPATPGKSIATSLASGGGRKRLREEDRCCRSR